MNNIIRLIILIGMVLIIHTCVWAQVIEQPDVGNVKKVAQSGFQYLKIPVDARAAAMGNVGLIQTGDAVNIFNNPAGIGHVESRSVFVGYTGWIADMSKQAVAVALSLKNYGVIGVHGAFMSLGDIQGTAPADNELGYVDTEMLDVGEYVAGVTYAKQLTNKFTVGGTVKFNHQNLHDEKMSVLGFDFGTMYDPGWKGTRIGMALRNFSGEFKYIRETMTLPYTFMVGVSTDILQMAGFDDGKHQWILAIEGNKVRDYSERVHIGTEFILSNIVAFRAGYKFNYDEEGLTLGSGINYSGIKLNYAYRDFGAIFGSISMLSASLSF